MTIKYQLPEDLADELRLRLTNKPVGDGLYPLIGDSISRDGTAVMVEGGPFYGCFLSPDGDAFIETYEWDDGTPFRDLTLVDRSRRAQIQTVVLAAGVNPRFAPLLAQLPQRPAGAATCPECKGVG